MGRGGKKKKQRCLRSDKDERTAETGLEVIQHSALAQVQKSEHAARERGRSETFVENLEEESMICFGQVLKS